MYSYLFDFYQNYIPTGSDGMVCTSGHRSALYEKIIHNNNIIKIM